MASFTLKAALAQLLLALLLASYNFESCGARRGRHSGPYRSHGHDKSCAGGRHGRSSAKCSSSKDLNFTSSPLMPPQQPNPVMEPTKHKAKPNPVMEPTKHKAKPNPSQKPNPKNKKSKPTPIPSPAPTSVPKPTPSPQPSPTAAPATKPGFLNVLDFGAKGNGASDDTKAFQEAWAAACKAGSTTILIPAGYEFLLGPISFAGPVCEPHIIFQLDGTITAPSSFNAWGSGLLQWLEFTKLRSITIQGSGTIEGGGSIWWNNADSPTDVELAGNRPHTKPTALRFYGSNDVSVSGITIQNSPKCHLKFDTCDGVNVFNVTISSPGDSPNTDGIHLENSMNVYVHSSQLACGDDCISIQTGCSNVSVREVKCGPGHGISIGGLGSDDTKACVSNVTVKNVELQGTLAGVRIKTWQGGSGAVQNIRFSQVQVSEVNMPIVIDQYYCDRSSCRNQSSAVALSGIFYEGVRGTYTTKPIHLACSEDVPCTGISLTDIELEPMQGSNHLYDPFCWNAYGELHSPIVPPIGCLVEKAPGEKQYVAPTPLSC